MDNTEVRGLSQNCAELKNRSQQRTFRSCCPVQLSSTVVTRHRKLLKLINFYKMKNSGSQSHQPRFKCSVATCSEVWIQNVYISADISIRQHYSGGGQAVKCYLTSQTYLQKQGEVCLGQLKITLSVQHHPNHLQEAFHNIY